MRSRDPSAEYTFSRHARQRQGERQVPTALVRLAIERGARVRDRRGDRFLLGVAQLDAAGFGPSQHALVVVTSGLTVVTVLWLDHADALEAA